ncbi:hypothetical protein BCR43DRAFT_154761 [Syncephalastrum racemosum]|uniref:Uncharacterized protein n=1 Tax=Syncephalastrum racemosum TaxID=13706 RepID=A0A1X2HN90_SYNRA|nr:hypothetical protein BCR43DRAFT_154761 [Syncephalastrum racemosum]
MEQKGGPPSVHSNAETELELEANDPDLILEAHQSIGGHELDLYHSKQHSINSQTTKAENLGDDAYLEDGGYGWFCVAGAFLAQFTAFGVASVW